MNPEPLPIPPANGAALTESDRDPDLCCDVVEFDLAESPFEGLAE